MQWSSFRNVCWRRAALWSAVLLLSTGMRAARAQVTLGQIDTFEDGTTQGWTVGAGGAPGPVNIATGGPAGAGDNFLEVSSTGRPGPGGRLVTINSSQWAGNYLAAGVNEITLDANNLGATDLSIRLLFADPMGGPPADVAVTSQALLLPAGSGWVHASFLIDPADLVAVLGSASAALANATEMRIFHNPAPDFPGPPVGIPDIAATLGVDNITAAAVPEPGTLAFFAGLVVPCAAYHIRRRR